MKTTEERDETWTKLGRVSQPDPVIYLDTVSATQFARDYKRRTFELLNPRPGARFLDVGCGTGEDVIELARLVGKDGKVIGVDKNPAMIAQGIERSRPLNLPVAFEVGDSHQLHFPDASFDGTRSDRAVQHMENPEKVLKEMARVTVRGGRVVISEPDWETLTIDTSQRATMRRIIEFISDRALRHGWIGRQLPALFRRAGLEAVEVAGDTMVIRNFDLADKIWGLTRHSARAVETEFISAAQRESWLTELKQADAAGLFFGAIVGFVTSGRRA
jgi:ubiquinone/menaquinone biosynthesis C-methylase UbiE